MFTSPGDVAFTIFGFNLYYYGITMALAISVGLFVAFLLKRRLYPEFTNDLMLDFSFYVISIGLLSARFYYVLLDFSFYSKHVGEIIAIWHGGLSIHGAIIGAVVASFLFCKIKRLNFLKIADIYVFGLVIGQVIGRWGNFFNSEAFGLPTSLPWKLYIPVASRPIQFLGESFYHPTFLYESLLNIIIFSLLFFVIKNKSIYRPGVVFFLYLILYSIVRYFVESIRIDSVLYVFSLPIAQWVSFALALIGAIGLFNLFSNRDNNL